MSQSNLNHNPATYVDVEDNIESDVKTNEPKNLNSTVFIGPKKNKGSFLYNKCQICISIFKWFPVLFICSILLWSYYAFILQLCIFTINSIFTKIFYIILFNILYFMTLWSYMQTVFTKSKSAPSAFMLRNDDYVRIMKEDTQEKRNQVLAEIAKERQLPLACRNYTGDIRLCAKCYCIKADRAHHCSVCSACILKMDHHCPWVNNCVSFSNYKFFILFLAYSFLLCLFGAVTTFPYFVEFWSVQMPTLGRFNILFLFFVSIMFSISLFSLFSYHIYLVLRNQTTLESFRSPIFAYGPNKNAFNLGKLNNFKEVFGEKKILWILPIYTSIGDGLQFSSSQEHAKHLTQHVSSNLMHQQQTTDANDISELNETRPVLNSTSDLSKETNFIIQMPGKLERAK